MTNPARVKRSPVFAGAACLALSFASGMGASHAAVLHLDRHGDNLFAVAATIDGTAASLTIDTGGSFNLLDADLARHLKLPDAGREFAGRLPGGVTLDRQVHVSALAIGGLPVQSGDFAVLPLPGGGGALGASWLSQFDLDLNLGQASIGLLSPGDCARLPAASRDFLPMWGSQSSQVLVQAVLDGKAVLAALDSGAGHSLLDPAAAVDLFGQPISDRPGSPVSLNGGEATGAQTRTFGALLLGPRRIGPIPIEILALHMKQRRAPQLIVGTDVLKRLRVCIGYTDRHIYFP